MFLLLETSSEKPAAWKCCMRVQHGTTSRPRDDQAETAGFDNMRGTEVDLSFHQLDQMRKPRLRWPPGGGGDQDDLTALSGFLTDPV